MQMALLKSTINKALPKTKFINKTNENTRPVEQIPQMTWMQCVSAEMVLPWLTFTLVSSIVVKPLSISTFNLPYLHTASFINSFLPFFCLKILVSGPSVLKLTGIPAWPQLSMGSTNINALVKLRWLVPSRPQVFPNPWASQHPGHLILCHASEPDMFHASVQRNTDETYLAMLIHMNKIHTSMNEMACKFIQYNIFICNAII